MLVVDPMRRLGISQICRHKWIRQGLGAEHPQFLVEIESTREFVQEECDKIFLDQVSLLLPNNTHTKNRF